MSKSTVCNVNTTTGYVDLATFAPSTAYAYGGENAITYFVSQVVKSTWFTIATARLTVTGTAKTGSEFQVQITRAGDVLLHTYFIVNVPAVVLTQATTVSTCTTTVANTGAKWVKRLGHNLFRECCISFTDLVAQKFTSAYMDFFYAFAVPAGKREGYLNMIGDTPDLNLEGLDWNTGRLPQKNIIVPLPFYFDQDSGVGIPMAALPYQEVRLNVVTAALDQLLSVWQINGTNLAPTTLSGSLFASGVIPDITEMSAYAHYALLGNDERKQMGCGVRDIYMIQTQETITGTSNPNASSTAAYTDIRFSHDIKYLYFGLVNTTNYQWDKSNYTSAPSFITNQGTWAHAEGFNTDPIKRIELRYENNIRFDMIVEQASLLVPYYYFESIPLETGYHAISYALDALSNNPCGSTNYSRLTNVSITLYYSDDGLRAQAGALSAACYGTFPYQVGILTQFANVFAPWAASKSDPIGNTTLGPNFYWKNQTFNIYICGVNWNITRVAGGAIGFPVL